MRDLPYTHTLTHPVQHGAETVSTLVFTRKPVAGDLRGMSLRELDKADNLMTLAARLCSVPPSVINQLDMEDFMELGAVLTDFLPGGQRTGSEPAG